MPMGNLFGGFGGLGDRLLGGHGSGNPYTGNSTGGAFGRGGGGTAFGGYGGMGRLAPMGGGMMHTMPVAQPNPMDSTQPVGPPVMAGGGLAGTQPVGSPVMAGGGLDSTQPVGGGMMHTMPVGPPGGGGGMMQPMQAGRGMPFGGGGGSADTRFLNSFRPSSRMF